MILTVLGLTVGDFQIWVQLREGRPRIRKEASHFGRLLCPTYNLDGRGLVLTR